MAPEVPTSAPAAGARTIRAAAARLFDRLDAPAPLFGPRWTRGIQASFVLFAAILLGLVARGVIAKAAPHAMPMGHDGDAHRFGLSLEKRKAMFSEIARHDAEWQTRAASRFHEAWRREDDRAAMERDYVRAMARRHKVNVSVVYLILDEGLRLQWTGPNGVPLDAAVVPLQQK